LCRKPTSINSLLPRDVAEQQQLDAARANNNKDDQTKHEETIYDCILSVNTIYAYFERCNSRRTDFNEVFQIGSAND
jgi:hypothetical protein